MRMGFAVICAPMLLVLAGCETPTARVNAPPHGQPYNTNDMQGTYAYMTDNAMLADMTVSDVHFMPHRALLSELGEMHLNRLASLVAAYGGEVRYNSNETDSQLNQARVATIREYLGDCGLTAPHTMVVSDLPGATGMDAAEAILIVDNEGMYQPKRKGGPTPTATPKTPTN